MKNSTRRPPAQFDYIVVGAGSAGSIVAARLCENPATRVLLLEAGPSDRYPIVQMPLGYGMSFYDPRRNWMYWSEPVPGLNGRSIYFPRGKLLGGSSSINAMVYIRGQSADFDDWETAGNAGWGWQAVGPAYEAMERQALPLGSMEAGAHGLCRTYFVGAERLGLHRNFNFNGTSQEGFGYYPVTINQGRRLSASRAFLWPAMRRPNLKVETGAGVTRITLAGRQATGVSYLRGGVQHEAAAAAAVILCAGAINSPQLLQLSGIGPGELLKANGIEVAHDAPHVGRNLQDHTAFDYNYRSQVATLNNELRPLLGKVYAGLRYLWNASGPLSWSMNHAGAFLRSNPERARANLQIYFCPTSYDRAPPRTKRVMSPDPFPGFSLSVSNCRPTSRGFVEIRSADPRVAPAIQPNLLATGDDMQEMIEGARHLRDLASTPELATIVAEEIRPGRSIDDAAAIAADIRERAYSIFHPCGTCRMAVDPESGVVDPQLRVHGIANLRVIDASIFPNIIAGNINAPSMLVGWRGAELVLNGGR